MRPHKDLTPAKEEAGAHAAMKRAEMGARLKLFMGDSGWKNAELARRAGIKAQAVTRYFAGKLNPVKLLPSLIRHGLDPYWFIDGRTNDEVRMEEAEMIRILRRNDFQTADDVKRLIGKAYKFEYITKPENINGITQEVIGQAIHEAEKRPI